MCNIAKTLKSTNIDKKIIGAFSLEKSYNPNLKINHMKFDQKPIDVDYNSSTDLIVITRDKQSKLRNAHYSDEEIKEREFKGDPFGNPFKRCKEDFELFKNNSSNNVSAIGVFDLAENFGSGFNLDNINNITTKNFKDLTFNKQISEGEKDALLFQISSSVVHKKIDDDLSVFPLRINRKRSRSAAATAKEACGGSNNKLSLDFLNKKSKAEGEKENAERIISEKDIYGDDDIIKKEEQIEEGMFFYFFYFIYF